MGRSALSRETHRAAPLLETDRLILRAHTIDDFEASAALWADPDVVRHIGGTPSTANESRMRLLRYGGLWPLLGYGYWAVTDRETGRFLGEVGFADFGREIDPPLAGRPEAGWVLAPSSWGRGLATEAVTAAYDWFDGQFADRETVCLVAPENAASLAIVAKFGFREWAHTTYRGEPTIILKR